MMKAGVSMPTTKQNDVLIIHVWPEPSHDVGRALYPNCKPISDERESDVWEKLRNLTINPNVRRDIVIMTCSPDQKSDVAEVLHEFVKDKCAPGRLKTIKPLVRSGNIWSPRPKEEGITISLLSYNETTGTWEPDDPVTPITKKPADEIIPRTLASSFDAKFIEAAYRKGEIGALLIWHPRTAEDYGLDGDDLRHLSYLKEQGVRTPIYIFHDTIHPDKWGVEIEGDANRAHRKHGNWEDAFPALSDVDLTPQEVIVDDYLIKGNIHLISAPPESYKTMQLIELSSAVLEQRPVFDLLKVNARYPIMFLCADMSQEQFDFYAAPFNLRKHGGDFRVMKCGNGIPNITDPVLQKAVKGRILILDTMLDFAHIQKAFESGEWNTFMENLRFLMTAHGCIAVVMTAHTTRAEVKSDSDTINRAEYFKDSVTFHGKTDIGFGCKVLKGTSQVKIERIKGRGFKKTYFSFTITVCDEEGNSNLDRGRFPVCTRPEDMTELTEQRKSQGGRKPDPEKQQKLDFLRSITGSSQERTDLMNKKFNSNHESGTVRKWLKESGDFDSEVN
jgi:hypothetical protein